MTNLPITTKIRPEGLRRWPPKQPEGNKIKGFKVKTSKKKLKGRYVSSAKQSKTSEPMSQECLKKFQKDISSKNGDIPIFV